MTDLARIRNERAELARKRAALDARDAELAVAEKVLLELSSSDAGLTEPQYAARNADGTTRRQRIVDALSGEKLWMTSGEINQAIAKRYGGFIKSTSFHPMISLLTKEGILMRNDDKLALRSRIGEGSQVND